MFSHRLYMYCTSVRQLDLLMVNVLCVYSCVRVSRIEGTFLHVFSCVHVFVCFVFDIFLNHMQKMSITQRRNVWKPNWLAIDNAYFEHLATLARNICKRFLSSRGGPCSKNVASGARMRRISRKLVARDSMTYMCNQ